MFLVDGKEVSCGAVLYTMQGGEPQYVLVEGTSGHIGFPKGHMEENETELDTAKREIYEEVHIRVDSFDTSFREMYTQSYLTKRGNVKDVIYYLTDFSDVESIQKQDEEVINLWILPYEKAKDTVNRPEERRILDCAHKYICEMLKK